MGSISNLDHTIFLEFRLKWSFDKFRASNSTCTLVGFAINLTGNEESSILT